MFSTGLAIQLVLKLVLNIKKIKTPSALAKTIFKKDIFSVAIFLGGFSGGFRVGIYSLFYIDYFNYLYFNQIYFHMTSYLNSRGKRRFTPDRLMLIQNNVGLFRQRGILRFENTKRRRDYYNKHTFTCFIVLTYTKAVFLVCEFVSELILNCPSYADFFYVSWNRTSM